MKILALDLALARTGWALLDGDRVRETNIITTDSSRLLRFRYLELYEALFTLFESNDLDIVLVEAPGWMRVSPRTSNQTLEAMLGAWTVCQVAFAQQQMWDDCELIRLDPGYAKRLLTGDQHAAKAVVQAALEAQGYAMDGLNNDQADAISIGVAWWRNEGRVREEER